jgi:hypothetical protein
VSAWEEELLVAAGNGDIEVCSSDSDPCLLVEGLAAILVWPGTTPHPERWVLRARDLAPVAERIGRLPACDRHFDPSQSARQQLEPLLGALVNGRYGLLYEAAADVQRDASMAAQRAGHTGQLMEWLGLHRVPGADALMLGCVPRSYADPAVVQRIRQRIAQGQRPVVVLLTAESSDVTFVVSGHEALEAYALSDMAPALLVLTSLTPRWLSPRQHSELTADAVAWCATLTEAHCDALTRAPAPVS